MSHRLCLRKYNIILPINECIVQSELEDKLLQLSLDLASSVVIVVVVWRQHTQRVSRLSIHCDGYCRCSGKRGDGDTVLKRGGVKKSRWMTRRDATW